MILLVRVVLLQKYRIGTRYRNKELLCRKKFIGMCPGTFSLLYKKDPGQLKKSGTCIYYSCHTISSLIQTILSVLEFHQINCFTQVADCNRRWGITPRPEELIVTLTIVHLCLKIKRLFSLVFRYWPFKYSITPIWIVHASRSWYSAEFSAAASFQFDKKPHSTITIGCFTCRRR